MGKTTDKCYIDLCTDQSEEQEGGGETDMVDMEVLSVTIDEVRSTLKRNE